MNANQFIPRQVFACQAALNQRLVGLEIFHQVHDGGCHALNNANTSAEVHFFTTFTVSKVSMADVQCPFCGHLEDKVVDSRETKEGEAIRRRRECLGCQKRFTTYERIDEVPYMVVKKDGRREKFDRQKVLSGLIKAGEKRPISTSKLANMVDRVEAKVTDSPDREISTIEIGELLMEGLRELDKIAYVRFASVYRDFQDEEAFFTELKALMRLKNP